MLIKDGSKLLLMKINILFSIMRMNLCMLMGRHIDVLKRHNLINKSSVIWKRHFVIGGWWAGYTIFHSVK